MYEHRDWDKDETVPFESLKGKTIKSVEGMDKGSEQVFFNCTDDTKFKLTYYDDCCASCSIEDIVGEANDLIGNEILIAEEVSSTEPEPAEKARREEEARKHKAEHGYDYDPYESETWTFYKLSTIKGSVTLRWYGSSNGYYSESATFEQIGSKK